VRLADLKRSQKRSKYSDKSALLVDTDRLQEVELRSLRGDENIQEAEPAGLPIDEGVVLPFHDIVAI